MGILSSLRSMMSDEGFTPSASSFPDIDTDSIERSLKLKATAKARGADNMPAPDQESSDATELQIVERMRFLRNQGREFYENMLTAYKARINRAEGITQEIKTGALSARNDFLTSASNSRVEITYWRMGVVDALEYLNTFRKKHGIDRPYMEETRKGIYSLTIVAVLMLAIETVMNGFFFAETSPQGQLGGMFFAFMFALVNVLASGLVGWFSLYKNHKNFLWQFLAFIVIIMFLCAALAFNLGIGLYRDALEVTGDVNLANDEWYYRVQNQDFVLQSIKSWVLFIIGFVISLITLTKTYFSFDSYPGYGAVQRRVENALNSYADELQETIADLEEKRDTFIEDFRESCDESDKFLSEAADALAGQATLAAKLNAFYEEVAGKTALLVQIYRDANLEARTDGKSPKCFKAKLGLDKQKVTKMSAGKFEEKAEARRKEIKEISDKAIHDISRIFEAYVSYFPSIDALRDGWKETDLPNWDETIKNLDFKTK